MNYSIIITLIGVVNGEHIIAIKPAIGRTYHRRFFSKNGLKEFIEANKNYCTHKNWHFEFKSI